MGVCCFRYVLRHMGKTVPNPPEYSQADSKALKFTVVAGLSLQGAPTFRHLPHTKQIHFD